MKIRLFRKICFAVTLMLIAVQLTAYEFNLNENGVILKGYDVVSYFDGSPVLGDPAFSTTHNSNIYYFSTQEHLDRFNQQPDHFQPQFGGYCAFGARHGKKFDIDPMAFEVIDNKLYVLLNPATKRLWLQDTNKNIEIANSIWPAIAAQSPQALDTP